MEKMTRREFMQAVIAIENIDAELKTYAENEIVKMDEKNAKRKEQISKKAQENEPIKVAIAEFLAGQEEPTTATVIAENVDGCTSTQKASALCRQMVEDGRLTATEVKVKGKGKQKGYSVA